MARHVPVGDGFPTRRRGGVEENSLGTRLERGTNPTLVRQWKNYVVGGVDNFLIRPVPVWRRSHRLAKPPHNGLGLARVGAIRETRVQGDKKKLPVEITDCNDVSVSNYPMATQADEGKPVIERAADRACTHLKDASNV